MQPPVFPLGQMTTGELNAYRRQLQNAVDKLGDVPVVAEMREKLDAITAEEDSRASIAAKPAGVADPGHPSHHSA